MFSPWATFRQYAIPGLLVYYTAMACGRALYPHGIAASIAGFLGGGLVTSVVVAWELARKGG